MKHYVINEKIFSFDDGAEIPDSITGEALTDQGLLDYFTARADELKRKNYAALRAAEYPDLLDYIDGVVKGDQTQIAAYVRACLDVKMKYPKG